MSDNNFSLSRVEQILKAALTDTEYGKVPQSRVEYLLLELIKKGGGGSAGGYIPSGNAYFDDLPTPSKDYLGYVYNMVEDFTTTADFLEGAGKTYPAGSNVAVVDAGSADNPKYMFDVLAGFIDLSDYVTTDALSDALQDYVDSDTLSALLDNYVQKEQGKGLSTNDYTSADKTAVGTIQNKVDKVEGKGLSTNDYTDEDKQSLDDIQSIIPSTATPQNPLATSADVSGNSIPSTSTTSPLTDSADGMVQGVTVYGRSKVVDGEIKSVGEGWAVVDFGTQDWNYSRDLESFYIDDDIGIVETGYTNAMPAPMFTNKYATTAFYNNAYFEGKNKAIAFAYKSGKRLYVKDTDYTNTTAFKTAMQGVLLCYQLADPTQGNTIAVKTDDGTGIDGTMATFETGTPLRGIPDTDVRDVMQWDGSAGTVTKNCAKVRLADLTWNWWNQYPNILYASVSGKQFGRCGMMCSAYPYRQDVDFAFESSLPDKTIYCSSNTDAIYLKNTDYSTKEDFVASLGDAELVYELAEPITTPLTDAEISAFRGLRTFDSTTNITISDEPNFEFDYLKNTANGQAVADIQKDLQGQISNMITVSPLLTLTAAGWDSTTKQQTVTFAHDTSRRNVIDITIGENAAWDAAGVYAVSETAAGITFECSEMPETALTFRVTSMEVS